MRCDQCRLLYRLRMVVVVVVLVGGSGGVGGACTDAGVGAGAGRFWRSQSQPARVRPLLLSGNELEPPSSNTFLSWLRGFYFTLATITVVVIGDITPATLRETVSCIIFILLGVS